MENERSEVIIESKYPEKDYIFRDEIVGYYPGGELANQSLRAYAIDNLYQKAGKAIIEKAIELGKPVVVESIIIDEAISNEYSMVPPSKYIFIAVKWKMMEEEG